MSVHARVEENGPCFRCHLDYHRLVIQHPGMDMDFISCVLMFRLNWFLYILTKYNVQSTAMIFRVMSSSLTLTGKTKMSIQCFAALCWMMHMLIMYVNNPCFSILSVTLPFHSLWS